MKNQIKYFLLVFLLAGFAISCSQDSIEPQNQLDETIELGEYLTISSPKCKVNCDCFDDFSHLAGGPFPVGTNIMTGPCTRPITINPFQFGSGAWFGGGAASIQPAPVPYMSGKTLFTNNTNVNFDLRCTVDGLCIDVADFGGNLNIRINGVFKNFNDFVDIDGMVIGGVLISVSYGPGGQPQTVCLCGLVSDFQIGGQELFLDDLCLGPCVEEKKCQCEEDFEAMDPGPYKVGNGTVFKDCEIEAIFRDFQWSGGTWTSGGVAEVVSSPVSWLSGQVMNLNNINMELLLPCEIDGLCMDIADLGGNLNLMINGDFVNFGSYAAIDGAVIGGVTVNVTYNGSGDPVSVCFDGPISEIFFGGQEFFVDNICLGPCL